jgi:Lrp/AsnC family leucine-responsive transcriptional regulator
MLSNDFDRADRAILHELQLDGRLRNVELAAKVNLSESACLRRVRRLEEAGVIERYVMLVNQARVGRPENVFVEITLDQQQQQGLARFETSIKAVAEVMDCYLMAGDADYLLRIVVANTADYERIHNKLTSLPGVARVRSSFTLRTVANRTEVPIS